MATAPPINGPRGPQGPTGPTGPAGVANEYDVSLTTTDNNAPHTIITYPVPANTVGNLRVECVAGVRISGALSAIHFDREVPVKRDGTGAAAVTAFSPNGTLTTRDSNVNSANITFTPSGGNILVQVTHTGTDPIYWRCTARMMVSLVIP